MSSWGTDLLKMAVCTFCSCRCPHPLTLVQAGKDESGQVEGSSHGTKAAAGAVRVMHLACMCRREALWSHLSQAPATALMRGWCAVCWRLASTPW